LKQKLTDNSFLADKIALRINNIPKKQCLSVLDAYHGGGSIWKNIQKKYQGKIKILKIDKEQKDDCFVLLGDNQKYFDSINLDSFDVIDLDAYGVPYEQLKSIFDRKYKGTIFVTFIQAMTGILPHGFLEELGYTKQMVEKCPTLFCKDGFKKMCNYLKKNGIERIRYRQKKAGIRKNYLCFSTN
jgi:hypothetical protein